MNTTQKNKRNSYLRIRDIFNGNENTPFINGVKALKTAVESYRTKVDELDELARRESETLTGIAQDKTSLKRSMCEDALPLAGALRALAKDQDDGQLRDQADVSLSDLQSKRDRDCADFCDTIAEKAEANQEKLISDYGITAEQLDKFAALVEAFDGVIGKAKIAISRRKKIAEGIKTQIKQIDDYLDDTLDELLLVFRERVTDSPEKKARRAFFDAYTEARKIDDSAASRSNGATPAPTPTPAGAKAGAV